MMLLSVHEVAAALNVSRSTVYRLLDDPGSPGGGLRTIKIGNRRLIDSQDLNRFVAELRDPVDRGYADSEKNSLRIPEPGYLSSPARRGHE